MTKIPLVMVPGLLCTEELWHEQAIDLADICDCLITSNSYRYNNLKDIAAAILVEAPAKFALAGLSMGGYIAFEIFRQAPQRVSALALLDTSARPDTLEQTKRRRDLIRLAQLGRFRGVTPQLLPLLVHPDRLDEQALTDRIMAMADGVGLEGFLRQQEAIMARPDSRPLLGNIGCPTLVLCGDSDLLTPPDCSQEMAAGIPGAILHMVPQCGHMSTMERPELVNAAMRQWLLSLSWPVAPGPAAV